MAADQLSNQQIAKILYEMAALYEMQGVQYKPRAYEKAALAIDSMGEEAAILYKKDGKKALESIAGVGESIAEHLEELLKTGTFAEYKKMKKQVPVNIEELIAVEGIGPQTVKTLYDELKIKDLKGLEKAIEKKKVRKIEGYGPKSEEKIKKGIEFLRQSAGRHVLGYIYPDIQKLAGQIEDFPEVTKLEVAGSVRRWQDTIGDIDILAVAKNHQKLIDKFVNLPHIEHVYSQGKDKVLARLKQGIDIDLRIIDNSSWGAALSYFTGSREHTLKLREMAKDRGYKLSEYGLFKGKRKLAGKTEAELYAKLGLKYIESELREMHGEIEAAQKSKLPKLIDWNDLKGDLQIQTSWTDGRHSIEEMADAAIEKGLEYIAITDHTKGLPMTGGSDEKRLEQQMQQIDVLNNKIYAKKKFRILKGAEVNIGKNGSLDIKDTVLKKLDVVGAAIHSHFSLSLKDQMMRLKKAMENPNVDIIFHLTGRRINKREPIKHDIEEIIKIAKETGTVLEIDAYPDRSDIRDEYIRKCAEAGVKMVIDTDAHAKEHLAFLKFGTAQARRGWATKDDILNTLPVDKLLESLK